MNFVTPRLLNEYYNVSSNECDPRATQSAYESLGQYYSPDDVQQFMSFIGGNPNFTVRYLVLLPTSRVHTPYYFMTIVSLS